MCCSCVAALLQGTDVMFRDFHCKSFWKRHSHARKVFIYTSCIMLLIMVAPPPAQPVSAVRRVPTTGMPVLATAMFADDEDSDAAQDMPSFRSMKKTESMSSDPLRRL